MKKYNYEEAIEVMKNGGIVAIADKLLNSLNRLEVYRMVGDDIVDMQGLKYEIGIDERFPLTVFGKDSMYVEIKIKSQEMTLFELAGFAEDKREYFFKVDDIDYFLHGDLFFKINTENHELHQATGGRYSIADNLKDKIINYVGFSVKAL